MEKSRNSVLILLAFFTTYVVWGSTHLFNKIAVTELPPFFLAAVRFLVAGLIIVISAWFMKLNLSITKQELINSIVSGFLFLVYGNGVFVWAINYIDSGFAALLASTQPLFILFLMRLIDGKPMKTNAIIGVTLGALGMYILVSQKQLVAQQGTLLGVFMIITCVLSWSYGSIFVSKAKLPKNYFVRTAYQMITGGVMLALTSLVLKEPWSLPTSWSAKAQGAMLFLCLFGSIAAFTAFNYLLKKVSPEKVATSAYVNPIIAILLGWLVLNEPISVQTLVAATVLLTGVYFITTKRHIKIRPFGR